MKKFFEVKNVTQTSADIFLYGTICLEKEYNWWTGEVMESETDIYLMDFKKKLDEIGNVETINLFINSPGGDVFVTSTIISMLQRVKDRGTKIEAYVDALAASAASFLIMIADNIHIYKNSMIMLHKPMSYAYGNSIDMQKVINELEEVENSTMIPMYMSKAKENITEDEIKTLIADESWLGAKRIQEYFNVTLEAEEKNIAACINEKVFKNYKHIPSELMFENSFQKIVITSNNTLEANNQTTDGKSDEDELVTDSKENKNSNNNVEKEAIVRNKLNLIRASLFIKKQKNNEKEGV